MQMSNFERATRRMRAQGFRPFSPDTHTGGSKRWIRDADMPQEVALSAARMDALIAAFAIGCLLGIVAGSTLASTVYSAVPQ